MKTDQIEAAVGQYWSKSFHNKSSITPNLQLSEDCLKLAFGKMSPSGKSRRPRPLLLVATFLSRSTFSEIFSNSDFFSKSCHFPDQGFSSRPAFYLKSFHLMLVCLTKSLLVCPPKWWTSSEIWHSYPLVNDVDSCVSRFSHSPRVTSLSICQEVFLFSRQVAKSGNASVGVNFELLRREREQA